MVMLFSSWIIGGLARRAVARTHEMLKPENLTNRPRSFRGPLVPLLAAIGFWVILVSAMLLGWRSSGWFGLILRPFVICVSSLVLDWLISRLPRGAQWSIFLNPFGHLYFLPYCFLIFAVAAFLAPWYGTQ
jgi:hypothetical protein